LITTALTQNNDRRTDTRALQCAICCGCSQRSNNNKLLRYRQRATASILPLANNVKYIDRKETKYPSKVPLLVGDPYSWPLHGCLTPGVHIPDGISAVFVWFNVVSNKQTNAHGQTDLGISVSERVRGFIWCIIAKNP